jgi:serine/threonine protein phosphatase PrpC
VVAFPAALNGARARRFVTADPFLCTVALSPNADAPFLILCCDGVWDVLSDADAVALVQSACSSDGPSGGERDTAKLLVKEALKRGSSDNLSAMVLFF